MPASSTEAPKLLWNERGLASNWSVMHWLCGLVWHLVWAWTIGIAEWRAWASLFILVVLALVFEILESQFARENVIWSLLGYGTTYGDGDTVTNASADVLFTLFGWLPVQLLVMYLGTAPELLGTLLGVATFALLLFLVLFRKEIARVKVYNEWLAARQREESDGPSFVRLSTRDVTPSRQA